VLEAAEDLARRQEASVTRADLARCLADVLGVDRLRLLLEHDRPLGEHERAPFRARLRRLLDGEPLAYVLGRQEFFGRSFGVGPEVLVPRQETELLVDLARERVAQGAAVFEPCTGSGCVGITLALERPDLRVVASDVSEPALARARDNALALGASLDLVLGSWWQPVAGRVFDALVANPPYVDAQRPELLDDRVRRHEPVLALVADPLDPLAAYRQLLQGGVDGLRAGALVLLEVGIDTAQPLLALVQGSRSYESTELLPDLAGLPRVLACRRR
jgi:release factor glutamine methyltransferase